MEKYISRLTGLPIKWKLIFIMMIMSTLLLLLVSIAYLIYGRYTVRLSLVEQLSVLTQVVADRSTAALTFDDVTQAKLNLAALRAKQAIVIACMYDIKGVIFANYQRSRSNPVICPVILKRDGEYFTDKQLDLYKSIHFDNAKIGSIFVRSDLTELNVYFYRYIELAGIVLLIAIGGGVLLSVQLQRAFSRPIDELVTTAQHISENNNYTVRCRKLSEDELGVLVDAFNDMLSQIQERDMAMITAKTKAEQAAQLAYAHEQKTRSSNIKLAIEIDERKKAEQQLAQYRDQLEVLVAQRTRELELVHQQLVRKERLATLGQLTATVSHELRNPLGTIRTSFYSISDRLHDKALGIERTLNRIERNIIRCDNIISELLDYSRISPLCYELTNIDTWVAELMNEFTVPANITIELELRSNKTIAIDRSRLRRAIINVYDNAIQAMQDPSLVPGGKLNIYTCVNAARLEIHLKDCGSGISQEIMAHIFEPLFSTKGFGVGLGLSIVKQIMEQHEGGVEMNSAIGEGCHVCLWLPIEPS